ncbi:flagellar filament capping protein FliD [Campylobacter sp. MIT 21-1685]|uniref:flagellar filament capping protein FliD n=1 Tax=unclassified Campylobacter TaxID=2593542 RepID=UPI00224A9CE1|nr:MULTISPECIES: flagellar filament capping protein FliD [unclassified Campylobacter]MCX2682917.1 flagellar filament capping protein FliD [Campylobacter sp. MIT 21-1684]MCX2751135.1 flagellar filament capping protein FliD [Campylobacter sp. MIT 21-1682]MCX2807398.1 flagellar filament capping protein FliD [Campylobacter sp. MIT 21-1685]
MAATGTVSNLNLAGTVLNQDMIDNLKKNEETGRLKLYTNQIETKTAIQKDFTELKTKLLSFQTAVSDLGDATVFAKRKVNANIKENPPASLTANNGVALQSMNVSVTQLAQKDVYQSVGFENNSGIINSSLKSSANFTLVQNGKEYVINVDKHTSYKDLASKITSATDGNIVAKIINTGEKNTPYRLTLTSKETGQDSTITFFDGKKVNDKYEVDFYATNILKKLGWDLHKGTQAGSNSIDEKDFKGGFGLKNSDSHIQTAQNAEFTLDGVKMIRSSNTITDLTVGLTLTLNKIGDINFDVEQDNEAVSKALEDLVNAYNDLITNVDAAIKFDPKNNIKGVLVGVTEVTSLRSTLITALFESQYVDGSYLDKDGNKIKSKVAVSLQDYGLTLNDSGTLSFSKSKFEEKAKKDPEFMESFFAGVTKYKELNYESELVKDGSLKSHYTNGIAFSAKKFQIVFNDENIDLSRTLDGKPFTLTGNSEEEMLQNLVNHINSFNIEGLSVNLEKIDKNGDKGVKLRFKSDNGSDFSIKGDASFLQQFGLKEETIVAEPIEGKGVFLKLKNTLKDTITGKNGSFTKFDDSLTAELKSLNKDKENEQKRINTKYDTLTAQFLAYNKILVKIDAQLKAVNAMINASNNNNNN